MARAGTAKAAAAAAALLLVLVTMAATVDAAEMTTTAPAGAATGRRGLRRAHRMGLTQCVARCGTTVTSCLLDCYGPPGSGAGGRSLLPICLLDCTNDAMFCATDCSTQALN